MKSHYVDNDTPELDPVQVRIALLLAGENLLTLSRKWGVVHVTLWRAAHNIHCQTGKGADLRRRLHAFINEHNNTKQQKG